MWFSVVAWSVKTDYCCQTLIFLPRSLCISCFSCFLLFLVTTLFIQSLLVVFLSLPCTKHYSSCRVFGTSVCPDCVTVLHPLDVPKGAWGGTRTGLLLLHISLVLDILDLGCLHSSCSFCPLYSDWLFLLHFSRYRMDNHVLLEHISNNPSLNFCPPPLKLSSHKCSDKA